MDIQAADRVDAGFDFDVVHHGVFAVGIGGGNDAEWLVKGDIDFLILDCNRFAIDGDGVVFRNGGTQFGFFTIDGYFTSLNESIGFAA